MELFPEDKPAAPQADTSPRFEDDPPSLFPVVDILLVGLGWLGALGILAGLISLATSGPAWTGIAGGIGLIVSTTMARAVIRAASEVNALRREEWQRHQR